MRSRRCCGGPPGPAPIPCYLCDIAPNDLIFEATANTGRVISPTVATYRAHLLNVDYQDIATTFGASVYWYIAGVPDDSNGVYDVLIYCNPLNGNRMSITLSRQPFGATPGFTQYEFSDDSTPDTLTIAQARASGAMEHATNDIDGQCDPLDLDFQLGGPAGTWTGTLTEAP